MVVVGFDVWGKSKEIFGMGVIRREPDE